MKQRLNELSLEVGQWAERNFPVHAPALGMVEETGELCHCFLKRLQGIRGFDNPEKFHEHADDAIADIAIYNLHKMFLDKIELDADPVCRAGFDMTQQGIIEHFFWNLSHDVSGMLAGGRFNGAMRPLSLRVFDHLVTVSDAIEIGFMETVEKTWAKVGKRDWVKNPANAHAV